MPRQRRLAHLLRVLIACLAFVCAFEAPVAAAGPARDASAWLAERSPQPAAPRAPAAPQREAFGLAVRPSVAFVASARSPGAQSPTIPRRDRRHLYLELLTLLC